MEIYDVAIIGSSPICITEAIYQTSKGKKVCLIEKGQLGGSWKYVDAMGFKNLEVGPHVFNGDKKGLKALRYLGLSPVKAKIWFYNITNRKLYKNMPAELCLEKATSWLGKIFENKINIFKLGYNIFMYFKNLFPKKNQVVCYLRGGVYELLNTLVHNKHWSQVNLIKKECVDVHSAELVNDQLAGNNQVVFADGESIYAGKVIVTSCTMLDFAKIYKKLFKSTSEILFKQKKFKSCQVVMLIKNNKKKISFSVFTDDESGYVGNKNFIVKRKIKYANDITECVSNANGVNLKKQNLSVFTAAVDPAEYSAVKNSIDINKLFSELKEINMISRESILHNYYSEVTTGVIVEEESMKIFNETYQSPIKFIHSESLMSSFASSYERWITSKT